MTPEYKKRLIHYMKGISSVGVLLYLLLGSIAPSATISIITFGLIFISLLLSVLLTGMKTLKTLNKHVLFTLLLVGWRIALNAGYFDRINEGSVSGEFYTFSFLSLCVMIFQVMASFVSLGTSPRDINTNENINKHNEQTKSKMNSIIYLLSPLNIALLGVMHVILAAFSTDG